MVIFYDEECTLCTRFKQALGLIDRDKAITFRPIQDETIYADFPELDPEECYQEIHMIKDGVIFRGGSVISEVAKTLPGVQKFAWLIDSESSQGAMKAFYGQINEMRLMQKKKCFRCGTKNQRKRVTRYKEGDL